MRADGIFIALDVEDGAAQDVALARALTEACPVDIFAQRGAPRPDGVVGTLELVEQNLDECVLCRLCLDAAAGYGEGAVKVIKLYDEGAVLA
jgi:NAD-dependent dihydropyrimidine dehydrogenase PreA subunit